MNCQKCGAENIETARFCKQCGDAVVAQTEQNIKCKTSPKLAKILTSILVVETIVIAIFIGFAYKQNIFAKKDKPSSSECGIAKDPVNLTSLSMSEAKIIATEFINKNLVQPGITATVSGQKLSNGLYELTLSLSDGRTVTSYMTTDGKKFFVQAMDIDALNKQKENSNSEIKKP